jgi:hypothetical protein
MSGRGGGGAGGGGRREGATLRGSTRRRRGESAGTPLSGDRPDVPAASRPGRHSPGIDQGADMRVGRTDRGRTGSRPSVERGRDLSRGRDRFTYQSPHRWLATRVLRAGLVTRSRRCGGQHASGRDLSDLLTTHRVSRPEPPTTSPGSRLLSPADPPMCRVVPDSRGDPASEGGHGGLDRAPWASDRRWFWTIAPEGAEMVSPSDTSPGWRADDPARPTTRHGRRPGTADDPARPHGDAPNGRA